jgi:hypothetical protein
LCRLQLCLCPNSKQGEAVNAGLAIEESFLLDCFLLLTPPSTTPQLRLHFERHMLLTVNRMKLPVKTSHHDGEITLSNVTPEFTYHQSLWAEARESEKGVSHKAFSGKADEPPRAPLTAFESKYWEMCNWDVSLHLPCDDLMTHGIISDFSHYLWRRCGCQPPADKAQLGKRRHFLRHPLWRRLVWS